MATFFFDSSAPVKYYVREVGSNWVTGIVDAQPPNKIVIAQITGVEIIAALARRVRMGLTTTTAGAAAINAFRSDFRVKYEVISITAQLIEDAMNLAELHWLRSYDAVQLAAATAFEAHMTASGVGPLTLVSADGELNQAVQTEDILTDDPHLHP